MSGAPTSGPRVIGAHGQGALTPGRVPVALIAAALAWAVLASAWFSFAPTVREKEGPFAVNAAGQAIREQKESSFVDAHGAWVVPFLLVPIALSAAPLLRGRSSIATTVCGTALVVLSLLFGAFSIGLYFMPSALLLLIGAATVELRRSPSPAG